MPATVSPLHAGSLARPTVNLNGTSASALLAGYVKALEALQLATEAVQQTQPHGRDYQTLEPAAFTEAALQHRQRLYALATVRDELQALAEHVA